MKIYIVDIIGKKSGMHYYLDAFKTLFVDNGMQSEIISNYEKDNVGFFPYIFKGNVLVKLSKLVFSYFKFLMFLLKKNKDEFVIYLSYGTFIDIGFILIATMFNKTLIDIHEITINDNKSNFLKFIYKLLYKYIIRNVIIHSESVKSKLRLFEFQGNMIYVPHFKYDFDTNINYENVDKEVIKSILKDKINLLFFGNIRKSKGIEELLKSIRSVQKMNNINPNNLNFIIAGQDNQKLISETEKNIYGVNFIIRHINDDEMKYLFLKSDYILLPYKEISQSGVIEVAYSFRKPIISSKISYFKKILDKYPSFGISIDFTNILETSNFFNNLKSIDNNDKYYSNKDIFKYSEENEFEKFIIKIKYFYKN